MDTLISGKLLKSRGWPEGKIIGLAKAAGEALLASGTSRDDVLDALDAVRAKPSEYLSDARFADLARETLRRTHVETAREADQLRDEPLAFQTWGADGIDAGAVEQMRHSLRLPISIAGALMPDAHVGYGLPIGGVLATQGAVIPYAVGVDIACFAGEVCVYGNDGGDYPLRELAERGEPVWIYARTRDGRVVPAEATAHRTRADAPLVRVHLNSGESVRCTPDHEWMLCDGTYKEAQLLSPGDELMPGERCVSRVEPLSEREPVYCLNVPEHENFALSAGVFVHNCRMRLSIYDVSPHLMGQKKAQFEKALDARTRFNAGGKWSGNDRPQHEVIDDPAWGATKLLKSLQYKAMEQLGTSGSGNHFVEWGSFELTEDAPDLNLKAGTYLALLSHSGSRGVGFKIANVYSQLATAQHPTLPPSVARLAWLDLGSEEGEEYWLSMELAGRFASATHGVIHRRVSDAVGLKEVASVENHHNFAWRETLADGTDVIVHRKGATPAGAGVLGVIPGSMGDAGYVVRGRGNANSLNSASHGAGRKMGRRAAEQSLTRAMRDNYLRERGVTLLGGGLDESPQAYKDIEEVMRAQQDLVDVVGKFSPRIVKMADEAGDV